MLEIKPRMIGLEQLRAATTDKKQAHANPA